MILTRILFILLTSFTIIACGKKSDSPDENKAPNTTPVTPEETTPPAMDLNPVAMKASTSSFELTRPLSKWKKNSISWDGAKGKAKGFATYKFAFISNQPPFKNYNWGYFSKEERNCDSDQIQVKLFLDEMDGTKTIKSSEMKLAANVPVDPSHWDYNIRVEVENAGNCEYIAMDLGIMVGG